MVDGGIDLMNESHHAVVPGVRVMALLVDIEPGGLCLERDKLGPPAGHQDVGATGQLREVPA